MTERPDFVAGNTRLRARSAALPTDAGWAATVRSVPSAYVGSARTVALVLLGRHDVGDCLALLRGSIHGAAPGDRLAAVSAVGRLTPAVAEDVAQARDGSAVVSRLAHHGLPDPRLERALSAAWHRFELHGDADELETALARAAHEAWEETLRPWRRGCGAVLATLAEERDRRNVVTAASGVRGRLIPAGRVPLSAVKAARSGDWSRVLLHRPEWRRPARRWPEHLEPAVLEAELRDLATRSASRLLHHGDVLTSDVLVGYAATVERAARGARRSGPEAA